MSKFSIRMENIQTFQETLKFINFSPDEKNIYYVPHPY